MREIETNASKREKCWQKSFPLWHHKTDFKAMTLQRK